MKTRRANKQQLRAAQQLRAKLLDLAWTAAGIAGFALVGIAGLLWRDSVIDLALAITGGTADGLATAGWLIFVAPFLAGFLCWLLADRIGKPGRIALLTLTVLLAVVALWFLPGCSRHHCRPTGAPQAFQTGTVFGALAAVPSAVGIGVAAATKSSNRLLAVLLVLPWLFLMLTLALLLDKS